MNKYFIYLLLTTSAVSFAMHSEDRSMNAIDLAGIRTLTKQVQRNSARTKSREIYCAHLSTKQQLIAIKTMSGSKSDICCGLSINNGSCLSAVPVEDKYFGLLEKKYHQMKADSR